MDKYFNTPTIDNFTISIIYLMDYFIISDGL